MERDESRGRASLPIGSLTSGVLSSLSVRDETTAGLPTKAPVAETITGQRETSLPTSTRLGEPGSATPTALQRRAMALVAQAPTGVLHRNPAALLPQCVRSSLAATWVEGGNDGYGWDGYVVGYDLTAPLAESDREQAIAIAEAAMCSATEQEIVSELGRLRALTVSRDIGGDLSLVFAAYTAELRCYPAEAIRDVLRSWPRTQRFWPSMAELIERLDRVVKPRHALCETLRREYRAPETSPDWMPAPTEEQKAEVAALLSKYGIAVDEHGRIHPPEVEPMTKEQRARVRGETAAYRLPDEEDPRVQARLREMGATEPSAA